MPAICTTVLLKIAYVTIAVINGVPGAEATLSWLERVAASLGCF